MDDPACANAEAQLLALIKQALELADQLERADVAIPLDEARVAIEGPVADHATLRALGADWLDE